MAKGAASTEASQQQAREAIRFAASLMRNGISDQVIQLKLTEMGYSAVQASAIVNELRRVRAQVRRRSGRRNMIIGALIAVVGIVAVLSLGQSAQGTTAYIAMWAAVLFGAAQFVGGLIQVRGK